MADDTQKLYREIMRDREAVTTIIQAGTPDKQVSTVVRIAGAKRLPVSAEAVEDFFRHQDRDLPDTKLETVVGGKGSSAPAGKKIDGDWTAWLGLPDDFLEGGGGNDTINGHDGNDVLDGGAGDDFLEGEMGNNTLTGGAGSDVFCFGNTGGTNVITDFNLGEDKISFYNPSIIGDMKVSTHDGSTYVSYGDSTIVFQGVEMTHDEVMACCH